MKALFHSTSADAAQLIERDGFVDSDFFGIADGVCLASRPLDVADGVARSATACFEVDVPIDFPIDDYEILEEGRPPDAYREWLVPATTVNAWTCRRCQF